MKLNIINFCHVPEVGGRERSMLGLGLTLTVRRGFLLKLLKIFRQYILKVVVK